MVSKPIFSRKGMTLTEASKLTGIPVRTLARWTPEPREDYLARVNEKRGRVRELRAQGLSMRAIANEIGCSVGTVHRYGTVAALQAENSPLATGSSSVRRGRGSTGRGAGLLC